MLSNPDVEAKIRPCKEGVPCNPILRGLTTITMVMKSTYPHRSFWEPIFPKKFRPSPFAGTCALVEEGHVGLVASVFKNAPIKNGKKKHRFKSGW